MTRLEAVDLTVHRGGRTILDGVSLVFEGGGFVAVIGPNGAGKSTLLSRLAGLEAADRGTVSLDGQSLTKVGLKALARRRAYLPQGARAEWPLSVERLVALGLTPTLPAFGGLPAQMQTQVDRAIAACDLADHRQQPATTLSGGELARAMLARALVGEPEILIVDEPIAGLDPRHALDTVVRLRALAEGGALVIAALHDLTLAARHASRIIVLDQGSVVGDGAPLAVLTPELLSAVFEVEGRVTGEGRAAVVDVLAVRPSPSRA
jgi:iron complex transport system ATP-binding protein